MTSTENGQPRFCILLIDDDRESLSAMTDWLERRSYEVISKANAEDAFASMNDGVAVIVTDLRMPDTDGMQVIRRARELAPHAVVIVVSGDSSIEKAVAAIREGAFDYLTKPIQLDELTHRIKMALHERALAAEIASLQLQLDEKYSVENMVGTSPAMRSLYERIKLVADTRSTVLVTGESGTGKELVARAIHTLSKRREQAFIPVNCAAIPETLVESELFGHEKGAFTGATDRKTGFFGLHKRARYSLTKLVSWRSACKPNFFEPSKVAASSVLAVRLKKKSMFG
jgi:DNA-binding NtrC family response regulator